MAGRPNVALRVLGIVCLSGLIAAASLLFLLLAACGLLTDLKGSERWISLAIVAGYGVIVFGGFFGIFKLAKGMTGAPATPESTQQAAPLPPPATPAENRKLLEPLRVAMAASIGLSFLAIVSFRFQAQGQGGPMPLVLLPFFVLNQLPYLLVFWLTRDGPERKGVGLAMTFSSVAAVYGLWSWGTALFLYMKMSMGVQPSVLISLLDIAATAAAAFFAFQLWRRGPETRNDVLILVGGVLGSIVYLAVVLGVQRFVLLRGLGG
ncbi:MAG: hypothetical protein ACRD2Q_09310 [Terriglobales bacterium]